MKKISLFIVFVLFLLPVIAQEQEVQVQKVSALSRWSISIEAGANAYDGDISAKSYNLWQNVRGGLSLGGTVDYSFTPAISLGLTYYHHPLVANNGTFILNSDLHYLAPVLSVNMLHLISQKIITDWRIWLFAGAGTTYFSSEWYKNDANSYKDPVKGDLEAAYSKTALVIPFGLHIEYNITKSLALGLKAQYVTTNTEYIDNRYEGAVNDFVEVGTMSLRWKFKANEKLHARNINWQAYSEIVPDESQALQDEVKGKMKEQDDLYGTLAKRLQDLEGRVGNIEALLSNDGPDDDGDGVPNHRDKDPNTPKNTPVDFWGYAISTKDYASIPIITFDNDKTDLDNSAYETIFLIAEILKADPALLVEVRGFTDYMGGNDYNLQLSTKRAERVKKELVDIYGIDAKRIGTNGKGKILSPSTEYRANRRVEFHFNEK